MSGDLQKLGSNIRVEMAQRSTEVLNWAMVFWVAQAAAVAGVMTAFR